MSNKQLGASAQFLPPRVWLAELTFGRMDGMSDIVLVTVSEGAWGQACSPTGS